MHENPEIDRLESLSKSDLTEFWFVIIKSGWIKMTVLQEIMILLQEKTPDI